MSTVSPVTVSLEDLKINNIAFPTLLQAFGPDSLGILIVSDLPSTFTTLRTQVLSNSSHLAALPRQKLDALTNEHAKYLVGWSHGKETLRPGVVDNLKGSYYINCAFYQDPARQSGDAARFPGFDEYTAANIWPDEEDIPGFKGSAEALITLTIDTAVLVARACDQFAQQDGVLGLAHPLLLAMEQKDVVDATRQQRETTALRPNGDGLICLGEGLRVVGMLLPGGCLSELRGLGCLRSFLAAGHPAVRLLLPHLRRPM